MLSPIQLSEKAMAPHSSTLAWKIPWTEEPGGLQSMGSLRVGHNWATSLSLSCIGEGNGSPLRCSCLENPRDGGAWWAAVYGVAKSQTRLKRLSSSSSSIQLCATPWTIYSPPSFSVHGILQGRLLEWVAIPFPRGSSQPRNQTCVFCVLCIDRRILYHCATCEAPVNRISFLSFLSVPDSIKSPTDIVLESLPSETAGKNNWLFLT